MFFPKSLLSDQRHCSPLNYNPKKQESLLTECFKVLSLAISRDWKVNGEMGSEIIKMVDIVHFLVASYGLMEINHKENSV